MGGSRDSTSPASWSNHRTSPQNVVPRNRAPQKNNYRTRIMLQNRGGTRHLPPTNSQVINNRISTKSFHRRRFLIDRNLLYINVLRWSPSECLDDSHRLTHSLRDGIHHTGKCEYPASFQCECTRSEAGFSNHAAYTSRGALPGLGSPRPGSCFYASCAADNLRALATNRIRQEKTRASLEDHQRGP